MPTSMVMETAAYARRLVAARAYYARHRDKILAAYKAKRDAQLSAPAPPQVAHCGAWHCYTGSDWQCSLCGWVPLHKEESDES